VKGNFHARFLGEGKTVTSFPYPMIRALNEKLPERQVSDVELAVNCLLKHIEDGLGQQADQAIVKIRRVFYLRELFFVGFFVFSVIFLRVLTGANIPK